MIGGPGGVIVQPNPVVEGQEVRIDYQGEGPLYVSVDGGSWAEVPTDPATGQATLTAPPGSAVLYFSNLNLPTPIETTVEVLSTRR